MADEAFHRGLALEAQGDESCVDAYFAACAWQWQSRCFEFWDSPAGDAIHEYDSRVARLLAAACKFRRLDPARGLTIQQDGATFVVPAVHHGFPWSPADFQCLHAPSTRHEPLLVRRYGCAGWGVPLVVERARCEADAFERRFAPEKSFFPATAVLRFDLAAGPHVGEAARPASAILEFYDPLRARTIQHETGAIPLASDLTASLVSTLEEAPRSYFAGFIEPGTSTTSARLNFLEPYQPGKVPVVLIHGLFSDPQGWADMINDLRAEPGFAERFQLWVFRYPTGQGFLQSAAALRTELRTAAVSLDPQGGDAALRNMVLVGHSMGGLIAKLQVTHSEELVWSRLASRPLETIVTTEAARALLAETCYFDPAPYVSRVIFISSPHQGSLCSSALFGRGAALLVEPSPQQAALHEQLVRDNPHAFNPAFERRFPTSIDMLVSGSPLLDAMRQMRLRPGVKLHNIIGVSHPLSLDGPSDGVVSVSSASHPGCESVLAVNSPHTKVHRSLKTSREVLRILHGHGVEPRTSDERS